MIGIKISQCPLSLQRDVLSQILSRWLIKYQQLLLIDSDQ